MQQSRISCAGLVVSVLLCLPRVAAADANLQNDYGTTALHEVAMFSNQREDGGLALTALLLGHGADFALLDYLIEQGAEHTVQWRASHFAPPVPAE